MRVRIAKYFIFLFILFSNLECRKDYLPPEITASNHFIVFDGVINIGVNSISTFLVSRSVNLLDSIPSIPELHAQLEIRGSNGVSFPLVDSQSNGTYSTAPLNLDPGVQYQLAASTSDGKKYLSDLVKAKTSPPIDSLNWDVVFDGAYNSEVLNLYVNTHDATGNTRYYRWECEETWQHSAVLPTPWVIVGNMITAPGEGKNTRNCWTIRSLGSVLLATTAELGEDVVSNILIEKFIKNDVRLNQKYSALVKQYPLDFAGYKYWLTVQKNSQSLGGLSDLQPSQIRGNIHGISNSNDPVLGYVSASTVQEKRILINNDSLNGWKWIPDFVCPFSTIQSNPVNFLIWDYPDTAASVYYFNSGMPPSINITSKQCTDCTYQGGSIVKPPYMPD